MSTDNWFNWGNQTLLKQLSNQILEDIWEINKQVGQTDSSLLKKTA